jgi:hypothetical protein
MSYLSCQKAHFRWQEAKTASHTSLLAVTQSTYQRSPRRTAQREDAPVHLGGIIVASASQPETSAVIRRNPGKACWWRMASYAQLPARWRLNVDVCTCHHGTLSAVFALLRANVKWCEMAQWHIGHIL